MLILLIALPLLTGLAAALPFPSRRGRLTFLLTMQIIETALVVWTLVSGRSYATNIWHLTESLTIAMKLDGRGRRVLRSDGGGMAAGPHLLRGVHESLPK